MKKLIITTSLILFAAMVFGQLTLNHKYDYSATIVKLETQGYKYYLMDVANSQCRIYNLDHSLSKTINCTVPNGYYLADIKYVSENLFDSDSEIEIVYTYYKYVQTTDSYYYIYGSRIVNDNGSIIQTIDGARYIYVNKTGDAEYKLFAYCFDYSVYPEKVWTNIYNLPGILYSSIGITNDQSYPNPATDVVKVEYSLPENFSNGNLFLIDNNGKTVNDFMIDRHSTHLDLDVSGLAKGVYYYFIKYGNSRSESKKIVIQ
jgi:hypothetical protein